MTPSKFLSHIIVRVAANPFCDLDKYSLNNARFLEALQLASYDLYQEYFSTLNNNKKLTDKKLLYAIVRYWLRMSTRSTPFGLFAGCGATSWASHQNFLINIQQAQRHTQLDSLILHQLIQEIVRNPVLKEGLRYFPNNSLYSVHDELRYVGYTLVDKKRSYKVNALTAKDILNSIVDLCQRGAQRSAIVQLLIRKYQINRGDAESYVDELITSQLLVHELEPNITGEKYLIRVVRILKNLCTNSSSTNISDKHDAEVVSEIVSLLEDLLDRLNRIDQDDTSIAEESLLIVDRLRNWLPNITGSRLFQIDITFPVIEQAKTHSNIPTSAQSDKEALSDIVNVLNKLASSITHPQLDAFAARFDQCFEDREIPLAVALDPDAGIDYLGQSESIISPLIEELSTPFPLKKDTLIWDHQQTFKWNLLQNTSWQKQHTVEITDEMLQDFTASEDDLPPSMSIMFRKVEGSRLYIDSIGGVSATNLLNRFAYADSTIHQVVKDICEQEQQNNPDVIFAEIVHLPESRTGNIVFHPANRAYEIPYLAAPSVEGDYQLPILDLYVSVAEGQVILRSRRLNKRIIPRLSTAHNYRFSELPVYRFLCDLQGQGLRYDLSFRWCEPFGRFKFTPRITYQNVILYPATWYFEEVDFAKLKKAKYPDEFFTAFRLFCQHWNLPRQWVLSDRDNELLVDSEQPLTVEAWWDLVKNRRLIRIKEFFAPAEKSVVNEQDETYAHQIVATWIKNKPTYQAILPHSFGTNLVTRTFLPSSEWICYKVYTAQANQDRLLEEAMMPLIQRWQKEHKLTKWFFIRYTDPDSHLRVRFCLTDTLHLSVVMHQFSEVLSPFVASGIVATLQSDTYRRELERYGGDFINQAEILFYYDSEATLYFLELTEGDEREDLRWLWALRSIDELLNDFQLPTPEKLSIVQTMKEKSALEFQMDKSLKLQLDAKYRVYRSSVSEMLTLQDSSNEFYPLVEILQNRSTCYSSAVLILLEAHQSGSLTVPITNLIRSFIHMLVNRLIPNQARFHELVLYDFLYREYRSEIARSRKQRASIQSSK